MEGDSMYTVSLLLLLTFPCSVLCMEDRCLFHNGKCVEHCPRKMHPYHTRCDVDTVSQRTCFYPNVIVIGYTCGWSRCDCDGSLYLTDDNDCVELEDCPAPRRSGRRRKKEKRRKGTNALSIRRVKVKDRDDDHLRPVDPVPLIAD